MKIKNIRKTIKITAVALMLASAAPTAVHADSINITSDKDVKTKSAGVYYAWGYVKCDPNHYTSVHLLEKNTDKIVALSGHLYGYGKVQNQTKTVSDYASKSKLAARVYYGWHE